MTVQPAGIRSFIPGEKSYGLYQTADPVQAKIPNAGSNTYQSKYARNAPGREVSQQQSMLLMQHQSLPITHDVPQPISERHSVGAERTAPFNAAGQDILTAQYQTLHKPLPAKRSEALPSINLYGTPMKP